MDSIREVFEQLGLELGATQPGCCDGAWIEESSGGVVESVDPSTGDVLGAVTLGGEDDYERVVSRSVAAFDSWRMLPAPARGEVIRQLGDELRRFKEPLGRLVSIEMGKIYQEGLGEVQEAIDIADFAVGLSRQLYGLSMHSERPHHRMYEQWHPLGPVGVITAFNFPVAVWAWNAMIAGVCGDTTIWKPSEITPLVSVAVQKICDRVLERNGQPGVMTLVNGLGDTIGQRMVDDRRLPLISATGSCRMGRIVGPGVAARGGRTLLELGGNNAMIVMDDADLDLALRGVLFGAAGTAGQRCTSTRRLFLQSGIHDGFLERLVKAYGQVKIGSPLEAGTLMGPLVNQQAVDSYLKAMELIKQQGGEVLCGGGRPSGFDRGFYVEPTIVRASADLPMIQQETFAPILYVMAFEGLDQAIGWHNDVPQGLSSAIFTSNVRSAEIFLSHRGSDCGIANVNLGTSGAEIGGAFGGEKDTGGGREAGSDSWKQYMRRQTNTINWGVDLPLAQGIQFG